MPKTAIAYAMPDLAPGENIGGGTIAVPEDKGDCGQQHHINDHGDQQRLNGCPLGPLNPPRHPNSRTHTPPRQPAGGGVVTPSEATIPRPAVAARRAGRPTRRRPKAHEGGEKWKRGSKRTNRSRGRSQTSGVDRSKEENKIPRHSTGDDGGHS